MSTITTPTVVRPATDEDAAAIEEVGHRTWPATYAFAGQEYVAHGLASWWSQEAVLRSLRDTTCLVAVRDGRVVGMGNVDLRPDVPVVWKLYVLPDQQGAGAGSALLAALVAVAAEGAEAVRLSYVDGNDRAAGFYARQGFVEIGRTAADRPDWPANVLLERRLR